MLSPRELFTLMVSLAAAATTLAVGWAVGRIALRHSSFASRFAVGSAIFATTIFLLLCSGGFRRATLIGLAVLPLAYALWRTRSPLRSRLEAPWFASALLTLYAALYAVYGLAPDIQADSTGYHLGLVNEWMRERVLPDRALFHDLVPHGLEMLYLFAFAFGRHTAATLVHFGFLLATVPLILRVANRLELPRWAGGAAAVFYFTSPVVGMSGTSAYTDAALVFFILATFEMLLDEAPAWAAGVCAGFCYAIKMTGGVGVFFGVGWLLWRRRSGRALALFAGAALLTMAPWLIRSFALTGNPIAPLGNALFPNPYFHPSLDAELRAGLSAFGRVPLLDLPLELTIRGAKLKEILGPVFLLLPLGVFALRERAGRLLAVAAVVFALPWLANGGARFLMPALPFASLLLALALDRILPSRGPLIASLLAAVTCLPAVVRTYAAPHAWVLGSLPAEGALRTVAPDVYLHRHLWSVSVAEAVERYTKPGEIVFDLAELPWAYTHWAPSGPWQSAAGERVATALDNALRRPPYREIHLRWPAKVECGTVTVRPARNSDEAWSAAEIVLLAGDVPIPAGREWQVDASLAGDEAPLVLDGNIATEYRSWSPARRGLWLQFRFPQPLRLDAVRLLTRDREATLLEAACDGRTAGQRTVGPLPVNDTRRSAVRMLRQEGIRFLVAPGQNSSWAGLTRAMQDDPEGWGVDHVAETADVHLFRIR